MPGALLGGARRRRGRFTRCVDAHTAVAPGDAQQAAVVQSVEQLRRRIRRTAEPVAHLAMREMSVHVAWVHCAVFAHEVEHGMCFAPVCFGPHCPRRAWVHQRMVLAADEAVVDEEVFFDGQPRVAPLEVAGAVVFDAVSQRQVLRARRSADRVGLHEAELADRTLQCGGREQAACDGVAAQIGEGDRHGVMMMHNEFPGDVPLSHVVDSIEWHDEPIWQPNWRFGV